MNPTNNTAIAETAIVSKRVRRMFGLSLHGWENWMIGSLIIAAAFALIAGFSTWAVVRLQRVELAESNERIARLNNETEKLRKQVAPRFLGTEFIEALKDQPKARVKIS